MTSLLFLLISACDFQAAYQKALEDAATGSVGINLDRLCPEATAAEKKEFQTSYEAIRNKASDYSKLSSKDTPASLEAAEAALKTKSVVDTKTVGQTDSAAWKEKEKLLVDRIAELEAENAKLKQEIVRTKFDSGASCSK